MELRQQATVRGLLRGAGAQKRKSARARSAEGGGVDADEVDGEGRNAKKELCGETQEIMGDVFGEQVWDREATLGLPRL